MKPQRRTFFYILVCITGSILAVFVLYVVSDRINHNPNGFIRLFPPHLTTPQKIKDIRYNSYYIAGMTGKNIYLGNNTDPTHLLKTDLLLKDTQHIRLKVPENIKLIPGLAKVQINGSRIFMTEGSSPLVLKGKLKDYALCIVDSTSFFSHPNPFLPMYLPCALITGSRPYWPEKTLLLLKCTWCRTSWKNRWTVFSALTVNYIITRIRQPWYMSIFTVTSLYVWILA